MDTEPSVCLACRERDEWVEMEPGEWERSVRGRCPDHQFDPAAESAVVERLRDWMTYTVDTYRGAGTREAINNRLTARSAAAAYTRVLDLIDKHS